MGSPEGRGLLAVQLTLIALVAGSLGFMFVSTGVYEEVRDGTVKVLCMSCIKLDYRTSGGLDYTFKTANGGPHPGFVLENLRDGPVFLHFSESSCPGCDTMLPPLQDFFDADFEKEEFFSKRLELGGREVTYIYIYRSNPEIPERFRESWKIYDKDQVSGFPMFTLVTRGYHHSGEVRPFYTTIYGVFGDTDPGRVDFLENILSESLEIYDRNTP